MESWNTKKSAALYNIADWSKGYFQINKSGNVCVSPEGENGPQLDLRKLVDDLVDRGLRMPIWLRFPDIVKSRLHGIRNCFKNACDSYDYKGAYRAVYPIKVNQQRHLVEDLIRFGKESNLGLEAGSKPELLVAIAMLENPEALLICNGFKDRDYIEIALSSTLIGRNTIIVVDRYAELELLIEVAQRMKIKPKIGFRLKLETQGSGKWSESSGARSKFGLNSTEVVDGIERLREVKMLDSLQLLHFHLGSQITSIRPIKESLREASRVFAEIYALGVDLKYVDVGGGLGVDYDGSKTNSENSLNYSEQEYANDVISAIGNICDEKKLPHPDIITESGRALVAYHSILICNVLGTNQVLNNDTPPIPTPNDHDQVKDMHDIYKNVSVKNLVESYHDALQTREESLNLFNLGYLRLKERARVEKLFWAVVAKIRKLVSSFKDIPEELEGLDRHIQDAYFCNFSVFQSVPDHWAVKQLFPVMPIHRLNEKPTRQATLMDLTCDSDGKMDRFIDIKDVKHSLSLHPLREREEYFIGFFLLGAYQEILGDLHNLFGDTDTAHVSVKGSDDYFIEHVVEGNSVSDVLNYVEYFKPTLLEQMRFAVEKSLKAKKLNLKEGRRLLRNYEEGLNGYTYLESIEANQVEAREHKPELAVKKEKPVHGLNNHP